MTSRRLIYTAAILAIALALLSLYWTWSDRGPRMDRKPFIALGEVVAEETIRALGNNGTIVIVTMEMSGPIATSTTEMQLASFLKVLQKDKAVSVLATETYRPPPYVDDDTVTVTDGLSDQFFLEVLRKYPSARAIVSFAGVPLLTSEQIRAWGADSPRVIVAGNVGLSPRGALKKLSAADIVLFAVTPRTTPPATDAPKTPREVFDQLYQIVTPNEADQIMETY